MFRFTVGVRARLLGAALLSLGLQCAEERDPINRVQPDFLDKGDLVPVTYQALAAGGMPGSLPRTLGSREPVFFTQTTIIAKPPSGGFVGVTEYSPLEKVRWEVTENVLLARRAYAFVRNAPAAPGGIGETADAGAVVAAFAIRSHFDIRRSYFEGTGEETNVVEENTSDRPWYQRRFMRVDWSRNLVESYGSPLEYERWRGQVRAEPVPVFVNGPDDPNRPVFDYRGSGASRQLAYFDVVNRAVLHPETVSFGETEPLVPLCALYDLAGTLDCAPAEVTFRLSFRRAEVRDYEPASLMVPQRADPNRGPEQLDMERFGFFDVTRVGFDRARGQVLDTERQHLATRHNLFVHHHAPATGAPGTRPCNGDAECGAGSVCAIANTPARPNARGLCAPAALEHVQGDPACTTDEDCAGIAGTARCDPATRTCGDAYLRCANDADCARVDPQSTCDTVVAQTRGDNRGLCRLPIRRRQVRPLVYHLSPNYPADMMPVTESVVRDWNAAFRDAVRAARRRECQIERAVAPGTSPDPCDVPAVTGVEGDARFVFVACHNPVWGTDPTKPGARSARELATARAAGWDLPACGPQGTRARLGDLRYNMIAGITEYDREGYWGLANLAADPETGEMVAARGAVWQGTTDAQAAELVDWVQLLAGTLRPQDVVRGENIAATMRQMGSGRRASAEVLDRPVREGIESLAAETARGYERLRVPGPGIGRPGMSLVSRDPERPGGRALATQRIARAGHLGDGTARAQRLRARLVNTPIERALMSPAQARLAPTARFDASEVSARVLDRASPLRGQSPATRRALAALRAQLQQHQCDYHAGANDDVLAGIARRIAMGEPIRANGEDADMAFGRDWVFRRADGSLDLDTVRLWARQFVHQGVLAHEIGHSLGMRHNFAASADAMNYHDRYWRLRTRGHRLGLRPRYEYLADPMDGRYYSRQEEDGRIEEYAYSSVMDYRGLNEDAHGLGRYDRAFIKNGYVGLVEAFRAVPREGRALQWARNTMGDGFSTNYDLQAWAGGGPVRGLHYTHIPEFHGTRADGTPNIGDDNRYDVFLRETRAREVPGFGDPPFTNVTADGRLLVPYRFDSDERAGLVWQNQPYDVGADAYESVRYVAGRWLDHYFIDSFARRRSGFSTEGYVNRQWGRYLENLRQVTQLLAFDRITDDEFFSGAMGWDAWRSDPAERSGVLNDATVALAMNAMVGQLLMPEVGDHARRTTVDGVRWAEADPTDSTFVSVELNRGRYFESTWRFDQGWWWYEQLDRAGSFYDKTMSLQAMTDPDLSLVGRDTAGDIRLFQLNAFTIYPAQMTRLFGGILSEDLADFAPIIRTDGEFEITRTDVARLSLPAGRNGRVINATRVPLDPQTRFTLQVWSAALTMSGFPATYDRRYLDFARVWLDGSREAVAVENPERDTVAFTDPWTRQVFRAQHFGTGAGEAGASVGASALVHRATGRTADEAGIGARMLLHARDLEAAWREALRMANAAEAARWEGELRRYLDLLRVMRDLTGTLDTL